MIDVPDHICMANVTIRVDGVLYFHWFFLTAMLDRIISSPISKPHIWHHFSWELFSLDELETGDRALLQTSRTTNQNIKNGRKITGITIITGHSADICADVFQGIK